MLGLVIGLLPLASAARPTPVHYCLSYPGGPSRADSIRLARVLEWDAVGDSGVARAIPFDLDSTHTPRLHVRVGRWVRGGETLSVRFGGDDWRYVYELRPAGARLSGTVRVETDMHLDEPLVSALTGHRCPGTS